MGKRYIIEVLLKARLFLQCVYRWSKVSSAHIFMELHHSEGDFDNDYDRNNLVKQAPTCLEIGRRWNLNTYHQ